MIHRRERQHLIAAGSVLRNSLVSAVVAVGIVLALAPGSNCPATATWRRTTLKPGSSAATRRTPSLADRAGCLRPTAPGFWSPTRRPGSVSLVDPKSARLLHELKTGDKPAGVALSRDGRRGVVTHWYGYDLAVLDIKDDKIAVAGRVEVGPEPRGVALSADGATAFVAVGVTNEVARVDLNARKVTGRLTVGREPREHRAFARRLAAAGGQRPLAERLARSTPSVESRRARFRSTATTSGRSPSAADGKTGYIANMRNRGFADDPEQHRPGLGARPAADARPARRLGLV